MSVCEYVLQETNKQTKADGLATVFADRHEAPDQQGWFARYILSPLCPDQMSEGSDLGRITVTVFSDLFPVYNGSPLSETHLTNKGNQCAHVVCSDAF